jgi:catechol 2,3-dioxygenase-like lactoylglutathione lyase family enzyme
MPIGATRVIHVNVNCSELEQSLRFYRDLIGLTPSVHTQPERPQPGGAFGLDTTRWDAWILTDERGMEGGVALDLLEWQEPRPSGAAPASPAELGFSRVGLTSTDLDALHARLVDAGVTCFGAPHTIETDAIETDAIETEVVPPVRAFVFVDPDGVLIEAVSGGRDALSFVSVNCSDLDASIAFYRDVVGLRPLARFSPGPGDGATLGLDGTMEMEMAYLTDPDAPVRFAIDLQHWKQPRSPTAAPRAANQVGIYRMAFATDDIERDYQTLLAAGMACLSPPTELDMGPGIPRLRALLFPDPDGAMLELIELLT